VLASLGLGFVAVFAISHFVFGVPVHGATLMGGRPSIQLREFSRPWVSDLPFLFLRVGGFWRGLDGAAKRPFATESWGSHRAVE
jgi:hypothetical protein